VDDISERRYLPGNPGEPGTTHSDDEVLLVRPREAEIESIIPDNDDWQPIVDTGAPPWRMICALGIDTPRGTFRGTGWFAGPRTVVTAGHNIFDRARFGGWADRITVAPGLNESDAPFSSFESQELRTIQRWIDGEDPDFDCGAIVLDEPIGERTGWFFTAALPDQDLQDAGANLSGYPVRSASGSQQLFHAKRILRTTPGRLFYAMDAEEGHSGSPIWIYQNDPTNPIVVGIHAAGVTATPPALGILANSGVRISLATVAAIADWIS